MTEAEDGTVHYAVRSNWHETRVETRKMAFHQEYASELMGARALNEFYKKYPDKTLYDKLHSSDVAFAVLVIRNNQALWYHQYLQSERGNDDIVQELQEEEGEHRGDNTSNCPQDLWTGMKEGSKHKYLSNHLVLV